MVKKIVKFIPLALAVSSGILYVTSVISYRSVNDVALEMQMLNRMRAFLYLFIGSLILYFIFRFIDILKLNRNNKDLVEYEDDYEEEDKTLEENTSFVSYDIDDEPRGNSFIKVLFYLLKLIILIIILFVVINFAINFKKKQKNVSNDNISIFIENIKEKFGC